MTKQYLIFTGLLSLVLVMTTGCVHLRAVSLIKTIDTSSVPQLDLSKGPASPFSLETRADKMQLPYDHLQWTFAKLPYVRGRIGQSANELILLDTGLGVMSCVTLDIVARESIPAHLDEPRIAFVESLDLRNISIKGFRAVIIDEQWRVYLAYVPVYRVRALTLGLPILRQFSYLSFDNRHLRVVFACKETFSPDDKLWWQQYPMNIEHNFLWVKIPIAGQSIRLVADSGGGQTFILSPDDWARIATNLKVKRHRVHQLPTWGGFVPIDIYTVAKLNVGDLCLRNVKIGVRQDSSAPSTIGLGCFRSDVVVFDFAHCILWVGTR